MARLWAGPQPQIEKEGQPDPDYLPRGRFPRRKPLMDEFDRECGYSYDHAYVFVRYVSYGHREFECSNCGDRDYNVDDAPEMMEVGALELAFLPKPNKSRETIQAIIQDRRNLDDHRARKRRRTLNDEEQGRG